MEKRLFQALDELNVKDTEGGTSFVVVCPNLVSADYSKAGTKITMGAAGNKVLHDIDSGKVVPLLVLVDKAEYDKVMTK